MLTLLGAGMKINLKKWAINLSKKECVLNMTQKLLLFDIDGTLITGKGIPKKVAIEVIHAHYPGLKNGDEVAFSGMTDPLIVQKVLQANGIEIDITDPKIEMILIDFIEKLGQAVNIENPPTVLPGVRALLQACAQEPRYDLALVTGNMAQGARIKLAAADLLNFFPVGAFGSDHYNRNLLPPIAINRSSTYYSKKYKKKDVWIIGDSTRDVECAKVNGLRCLAVETGKISGTDLEQAGADVVLQDLTDIKKIFHIFNS